MQLISTTQNQGNRGCVSNGILIPDMVHYFRPGPIGLWSNVVHCIGDRVIFGIQNYTQKKGFQKGSSAVPIGEAFLVPGRTLCGKGCTLNPKGFYQKQKGST